MKEYRVSGWQHPYLELKKSNIHGKGLFAKDLIEAGEIVVIYGGKLYSREDVLSGFAKMETLLRIDEYLWIGYPAGTEPRRDDFINHSCDSNLWFKNATTLSAKRDILRGEEVTLDYSIQSMDPKWTLEVKCNCKSEFCRSSITGNDWKMPELQKRYEGHFTPYINGRIISAME